ncbi:hypothetical protein K466DRAFT_606519 [Polyporus arcularius HHB13444]|uniref:Uncharacterized protein n=1 Tax=Polyporus arcularius HHB13444 TaxID=1314778 RepID=A0A5C3NRG0_9APHY|nr:hypothetical protein K466DRAFT_606519 [Polyporus arcularius HHB13444]
MLNSDTPILDAARVVPDVADDAFVALGHNPSAVRSLITAASLQFHYADGQHSHWQPFTDVQSNKSSAGWLLIDLQNRAGIISSESSSICVTHDSPPAFTVPLNLDANLNNVALVPVSCESQPPSGVPSPELLPASRNCAPSVVQVDGPGLSTISPSTSKDDECGPRRIPPSTSHSQLDTRTPCCTYPASLSFRHFK